MIGRLRRLRRLQSRYDLSTSLTWGSKMTQFHSFKGEGGVDHKDRPNAIFKDEEEEGEKKKKMLNPVNNKVQQLLDQDSIGGWEECWNSGATPWDLGRPTPILLHLHATCALPYGIALVPGCGTGHDVVAIACPQRYVVGLDISDTAINKAIQMSSSSPNADYLSFIRADFFSWQPHQLFDLIFDYTFFCALEPHMRSTWAGRIQDLLKPDGELITLMFPISDHLDGPPYKVSISDYAEVLNPFGFKAISISENELAVGPRKGREKLGRWKRSKTCLL